MKKFNLTNDKLLDISFRKQLRTNPKDVLKSFDIDQLDYDVKVVSNSKDTTFFVLHDLHGLDVDDYLTKIQAANDVSTAGSVTSLGSVATVSSVGVCLGTLTSVGTVGTVSTSGCSN